MTAPAVSVERIAGHTRVTLRRPDRLNALNRQVFGELRQAVDDASADDACRLVSIHGEGRGFCAGADVAELEAGEREVRSWLEEGQALFRDIASLPVPTVAVVDGLALGGGFELVLACDLVLATTRARFGLPEPTLGLIPGLGGTQRLPSAVAPPIARRMLLTGEPIPADEAWEIGLLSWRPVDPDHLDDAVGSLVERVRGLSGTAVRSIAALGRGASGQGLDDGLADETEHAVRAVRSDDGREGIRALLEKRTPSFRGSD